MLYLFAQGMPMHFQNKMMPGQKTRDPEPGDSAFNYAEVLADGARA